LEPGSFLFLILMIFPMVLKPAFIDFFSVFSMEQPNAFNYGDLKHGLDSEAGYSSLFYH